MYFDVTKYKFSIHIYNTTPKNIRMIPEKPGRTDRDWLFIQQSVKPYLFGKRI